MCLVDLIERLELISDLRIRQLIMESLAEARHSQNAAHFMSGLFELVHLDHEVVLDLDVHLQFSVNHLLVLTELVVMTFYDSLHSRNFELVLGDQCLLLRLEPCLQFLDFLIVFEYEHLLIRRLVGRQRQ